ncbi:PDDEXK nuclease domain-containing protein [Parabacteroides bouchesdurhonensis]|uniref:PDDEXK nuclease domain-containing protein n=1 Tax=Parabacteroides bouchesdurhonensis TaxID=1936995 RepID=UPI000C8552C4|nr:PDDEXK nuclease domain-containing protein [Parabacteroides bouchesdurhonensis]
MNKEITTTIDDNEYSLILQQAVAVIHSVRTTIARQINNTVNSAYWNIGKLLFDKHLEGGYGSGVVKRLSVDLKAEFPDMGLSPRNLWYMKRYYELYYQADIKVQQSVALLPWGHNTLLIDKELPLEQVLFYSQEAIQKGWKKELLLNAIKMNTYAIRQQQLKSNNFDVALPESQVDYANEVFRSSYNLGFLGITEPVKELELEKRLVVKIKSFLLELGRGFSFIGNQYRLEYNNKEYFVDMLFFHRGLRALVAVELKIGAFQAEYVGKMNLYLSLLDRLEKGADENPSIGIILCADKNHLDVEIALQDVNKPIGVAEYQLLLPKEELQALILQEINSKDPIN